LDKWEAIFQYAEGVPADEEERFRIVQTKAVLGDVNAQLKLAEAYREGKAVPKNNEKAFEWYLKAALTGDAEAQQAIGWALQNGVGVPKKPEESVRWLQKAVRKGHSTAMVNLGWASLVSGYKSNNSIWLKSPPLGFLNSFFISSSCKAIFSNG
jgi:TPR repeat protein